MGRAPYLRSLLRLFLFLAAVGLRFRRWQALITRLIHSVARLILPIQQIYFRRELAHFAPQMV